MQKIRVSISAFAPFKIFLKIVLRPKLPIVIAKLVSLPRSFVYWLAIPSIWIAAIWEADPTAVIEAISWSYLSTLEVQDYKESAEYRLFVKMGLINE